MSENKSLKQYIDELIHEVEKELDETNVTGNVDGYQTPHAFSRKSDSERRKKNATQLGYSIVDNDVNNIDESTPNEVIKDLDKVKNDLIKKVDVLIAKKKKLYSNVDITTPMSADEKKLDKDIQDIFSQIQQLILQKRSLKKESVNEGFKSEYKGNDGIVWKKGKSRGDVTNFTPYYKGHDIDIGGYNFKTEKELKDFIKNFILSIQLYNKYRFESVNEDFKVVVGKTIFSDGKGKLFFGYYKEDDSVHFVDYKTWKGLSFKDVSKGDTNKERVIKAIIKNQKQFNKKVDFNMWAKKTNPSFEQTMDWFIQNGWISNINKGGIKESVDVLSVNEAKTYKKGDKLRIKLPNGKTFDVVFDAYSRTKGIAYGKFKIDGEVDTKPFSISSIVESVNEDRKSNILGIDFKISESEKGLVFSFKDKKEASVKVREIGSNKIVNLIQNSLDKAYGKGSYFFKGGSHSEFSNGYFFQKNPSNTDLDKLKFESVNEGKVKRPVNRWLELKNDETMHANKKLAVGLKELKYQLAEVEKFFSWYNKIKNINELDSNDYWKRTNGHIYKIKERIINIARTLKEIEK